MKPPVGMFAPVNRVKIASPRKIPKPSAKSLSDVANGVNVLDSWQMPPVAMRIKASYLVQALPDPVESRESDETVVVEINANGADLAAEAAATSAGPASCRADRASVK